MPLNQYQQEFIHIALEDYFQTFIEKKLNEFEFTQTVQILRDALLDNATDDTLDDFTLASCLRYPEKYFLHLERRQTPNTDEPPLTLEDVKLYLANYTFAYLSKKAESYHSPTSKFDLNQLWKHEVLLASITLLANLNPQKTLFVSEKSREYDQITPWHDQVDGRIYTKTLYGQQGDVTTHVEVILNKNYKIERSIVVGSYLDEYGRVMHFDSTEEEDDYIAEFSDEAEEVAEKFAVTTALNFLIEQNRVHTEDFNNIDDNGHPYLTSVGKTLLTYSYYFNRVYRGDYRLSTLNEFGHKELSRLTNTSLIEFLKHDILDLQKVINLTDEEIKLISCAYHKKNIIENHTPINALLSKANKYAILIHPTIINLLKWEKISITQASILETYTLQLLYQPTYFQRLQCTEEPIDWKKFAAIPALFCNLLCRPPVVSFLVANSIPLTQAYSEDAEYSLIKLAFGDYLTNTWNNNMVSLEELLAIKHEVTAQFDTHPFLKSWVEMHFIELNTIGNQTLTEITTKLFAVRLFHIFKNKPFTQNFEVDTISAINDEINQVATLHKQNVDDYKENVCRLLIKHIKHHLNKEDDYDHQYYCFITFLQQQEKDIRRIEEKAHFWKTALDDLIHFTPTILPNFASSDSPGEKRKYSTMYPPIAKNYKHTLSMFLELIDNQKSLISECR